MSSLGSTHYAAESGALRERKAGGNCESAETKYEQRRTATANDKLNRGFIDERLPRGLSSSGVDVTLVPNQKYAHW